MSIYFPNGITVITSGGSVITIGGSGQGEKTYYGEETVESIFCSSSVTLNGTTVEGAVDTGGSVTSTSASMASIDVGGDITLASSNCAGKAAAGGSITSTSSVAKSLDAEGSINAIASTVSNRLHADKNVTATRCEKIGQVHAGGSANISDCPDVGSITTDNHVALNRTTVKGNVTSRGDATITRSQIGGTLTCTSNHLVIERSRIDTLVLNCGIPQMSGGTSIASTGLSFSNMTFGGGGGMTFGSGITINGIPPSQLMAASQKGSFSSDGKSTGTVQKLELVDCVVKNIVFKGGSGEVTLSGTSNITGEITGGKIKE